MPLLIVRKKKWSLRLAMMLANPTRLIVLSFLVLIALGTLLLSLPIASQGQPTPLFTAFFTATSATCVTGLVLVDTASHFSRFGQTVILLLIQFGGLGLATVTTFFFHLMGRQRSWRVLSLEREMTAAESEHNMGSLLSFIMLFTLVMEAAGALILTVRFWPRYRAEGIWRAVFQSVSAFCNAGFDLHGTEKQPFVSLTGFNDDPVVLLVTAFLVIAGGLGFLVWRTLLQRRGEGLKFHTGIVLRLTLILLVVGTVFFFLVESASHGQPGLADLPTGQRLLAAFFQSATSRTAGFCSIDQASLSDSAKFVMSLFMFIGAAPAGTAGGIKVTTFAVVLAFAVSSLKPEQNPVLRRHQLRRSTAARAVAIFSLSLTLVIVSTLTISIIEQALMQNREEHFLHYFFEVTSAFGTVGLSTIGTSTLHMASQSILTFLMFVGRVGPLSFAIALMRREAAADVVLPEGHIIVG